MKVHFRVLVAALALAVAGAVTAPATQTFAGPLVAGAAAARAVAGAVVPVTPSRIADSRSGLQIHGAVDALQTARIRVAGRGGIPANGAAAVAATVTVTGPQSPGHVTVWPSGATMPGTSNLNFLPDQTVSNTVFVGLGTDGSIQLFNGSSGSTQMIVDVTGYVRAGSASAPGALVIPENPQRLADSRIGMQLNGPIAAFGTASVQAVPGPVGDVVLTVTVVDPPAGGYLTVFPGYSTRPGTSNLNFQVGRTVAATMIVPVSANGVVDVFNGSSGAVQVIVDISGFTLPGTPVAAGTIAPVTARIADSRLGLQIPGPTAPLGSAVVQVASPDSGVAAAIATVTVVDPQAPGYVTVWKAGTRLPGTSNLNFGAGQTVATTVIVPLDRDGRMQLFNGSPGAVQLVVDITGYTLTGRATHGTVWAWGAASNGQLGNGQLGVNGAGNSAVPVPVFGLGRVTAVAGGGTAAYALRRDGTVWSWGTGAFGQRGTGAYSAILTPVPLQIPGLARVTAIAAGYGTGYALRRDGTVWSWGDGQSGALGDGDDELYSTVPVQVYGVTGAIAIAAGDATGYALLGDGTVLAWGAGGVGQLGDGGTTNGLATPVHGLTDVTAIGAGGATGYAVREDGTAWAWGDGSWGQLGNGLGGPESRSLEPVQVPGPADVTAITGASFTGYALQGDGSVVAWGEGIYGELGNGSTSTLSGPVPVSGLTGITAVAAGRFNGYALDGDGTVWAWGQGALGTLGNGTTADGLSPAAVSGLGVVMAIAAGGSAAYAVIR